MADLHLNCTGKAHYFPFIESENTFCAGRRVMRFGR